MRQQMLPPRVKRRKTLTLVHADVAGIVEREVQVLKDLREPEALHVVDEPAPIGRVDVVDWRVRDGGRLEVRPEALVRGDRALVVLDVACVAPRVEVGLEHLGAHIVIRSCDEESMLIIECNLLCGWDRAGVVAVAREVGEGLWANAGARCQAVRERLRRMRKERRTPCSCRCSSSPR